MGRKFCVMTSGRAASTALMDIIATVDSVVVPNADIDCSDHELLHPKRVSARAAAYAGMTGKRIRNIPDLVNAFYAYHSNAELVGFKSMCNRHPHLSAFLAWREIQFITLVRLDIPATVASFMLAMEQNTWIRDGGTPNRSWEFGPHNRARVNANIAYIARSNRALASIPNAIALTYEELCSRDFCNSRLDAYFGMRIALDKPMPPTDPSTYVVNWRKFESFVQDRWSAVSALRPHPFEPI